MVSFDEVNFNWFFKILQKVKFLKLLITRNTHAKKKELVGYIKCARYFTFLKSVIGLITKFIFDRKLRKLTLKAL